MKLLLRLSLLALSVLFPSAPAQSADTASEALVMISGDSVNVSAEDSSDGELKSPKWAGANAGRVLLGTFPNTSGWGQSSFSFLPESDGIVSILARGPLIKSTESPDQLVPAFVDFDEFTVDGAEIVNGSFEETTSNDVPVGWKYYVPSTNVTPITEANRARVVHGDAAAGHNFIRVWHNSAFAATIKVIAGQKVTITFSHRESPGK
ncbi:MAG: hypothetical protein BGO12_17305 [Verrucomicrobia bacterium 61-8]|nr:hypothetical protein [Verrucomicrobiota bacterium]OJV24380.1 MAG: hypothetical protein BGO12_17305 [Verrucomicrobia bacterium 61-8]